MAARLLCTLRLLYIFCILRLYVTAAGGWWWAGGSTSTHTKRIHLLADHRWHGAFSRQAKVAIDAFRYLKSLQFPVESSPPFLYKYGTRLKTKILARTCLARKKKANLYSPTAGIHLRCIYMRVLPNMQSTYWQQTCTYSRAVTMGPLS